MVGHANPRVAEAVARQMATLPTTNILHQSDTLIAYCTRLAGLTPEGLTKIAVLAGGGEAIEAAVKLAMRVTGRTEVLSLHGAYHGMSLATMGLAGIAGDRSWLPGAVRWPTFRQVPNADTYRNPPRRRGLGGVRPGAGKRPGRRLRAGRRVRHGDRPGAGRARAVPARAITRRSSGPAHERNVLLIVDEIQTGLARCGATWACDLFGVRPDILVVNRRWAAACRSG